jgi:hypothetical protein
MIKKTLRFIITSFSMCVLVLFAIPVSVTMLFFSVRMLITGDEQLDAFVIYTFGISTVFSVLALSVRSYRRSIKRYCSDWTMLLPRSIGEFIRK